MISNNDLMKALYSGDLEAIKTSLKNGADDEIINNDGKTVWDYANDKEDMTEFLVCTLLEESERE